MSKAKKSESKPVQNAEEAVTSVLLARLAAKIAPALCLNEPQQAIEAAAALIECAREWLAMPDAEDEKTQLKAIAEHADKYGLKPTGGKLSLADAFRLQSEERFWKGKRREGAYKSKAAFVAALRMEGLTLTGIPKGTEETPKNYATGKGKVRLKKAVEETTENAVEEFFKRRREQRLKNDRDRHEKKRSNKKIVRNFLGT